MLHGTTSASLADAIIASEKAWFSGQFYNEGVRPEGCATTTFPRVMGEAMAKRILGREGWEPSAQEAKEAGLVSEVVRHEQLIQRALEMANQWSKSNKTRRVGLGHGSVDEYLNINMAESFGVADDFLSDKFLNWLEQRFTSDEESWWFIYPVKILRNTRFLWKYFLPSEDEKAQYSSQPNLQTVWNR